MKLLAISGSLRAASSNGALLDAAQKLAPADCEFTFYGGLAGLPHFNPDLDVEPVPHPVAQWRALVGWADALIISSPEYARGVPGSLKNALDWLVSSEVAYQKPAALFNASPRGTDARAALTLVLETMSVRIVEAAMVTLPVSGGSIGVDEILADAALAATIRQAFDVMRAALTHSSPE